MWLTYGIKTVFLTIIFFYWFYQIQLLIQIQIFLSICLFSNMEKKNSEYFSVHFWDSHFYVLICGQIFFLLTFIRFYWIDQKHLLKQIQIFLRIYPFSNMVRKRNSLSISMLVSEIVILCLKRKVLYEFLQKFFKTNERYSLAVCGLVCGEKHFC